MKFTNTVIASLVLPIAAALLVAVNSGCRSNPASLPQRSSSFDTDSAVRSSQSPAVEAKDNASNNSFPVVQAGYQDEDGRSEDALISEATANEDSARPDLEPVDGVADSDAESEKVAASTAALDPPVDVNNAVDEDILSLEAVLEATVDFYPEIEAAIREFQIAGGQSLQAQGNFDTKLKVSSENTPIGFYETYRSKFGIERPTFNGGSLFAGYRFGRGDFEPWYLERNTNELGELKLGANWSLLRGREIDARRVELWQANLQRRSVEPQVQNQLIEALREAEVAYWSWVVAGQTYQLNNRLLTIAKNRIEGIEERIKAGDLSEITRTDNDRSILSREVKLIKARAKLEQTAIKLSLFHRDSSGQPLMPGVNQVPPLSISRLSDSLGRPDVIVANAIECRPEVKLISLEMKAICLDIKKARNDLLPQLDAQVAVSQDFGDPTSASAAASSSTQELFVFFDEKDEFQVDANLSLTQSLQRRKATGKVRSLQGKLRQLHIKRSFLQQKIEAEVRQNYQLTVAASEQYQVASRSLELAQTLSEAARQRYAEGDVDLFEIIIREQQELDSAMDQIESTFNYHFNRANLNAAIGCLQNEELERLLR